MCLVFDGTPLAAEGHDEFYTGNPLPRVGSGGGPTERNEETISTFTSVSQRRQIGSASSTVDTERVETDSFMAQYPQLSLDPTLRRLYRSQKEKNNARQQPLPQEIDGNAVTRCSKARLDAKARVEALIEQRLRHTMPTAENRKAANRSSSDVAAAVKPCAAAPTLKRDHLSSAAPQPSHPPVVDSQAKGDSGLSLRDRWKMTSAHYRRVTETLSPSRHQRRSSSGPYNSSPQSSHHSTHDAIALLLLPVGGCDHHHDDEHLPSMRRTQLTTSNPSIYEGYVSPLEALFGGGNTRERL